MMEMRWRITKVARIAYLNDKFNFLRFIMGVTGLLYLWAWGYDILGDF